MRGRNGESVAGAADEWIGQAEPIHVGVGEPV